MHRGGCTVEAVDAVFDWIWTRRPRRRQRRRRSRRCCNASASTPARSADDAIKAALRANTDAALAAGVFGVPTLQVGDALFWGNDAHGFALAAIDDATLLRDAEMQRLATLPDRGDAAGGRTGPMTPP